MFENGFIPSNGDIPCSHIYNLIFIRCIFINLDFIKVNFIFHNLFCQDII